MLQVDYDIEQTKKKIKPLRLSYKAYQSYINSVIGAGKNSRELVAKKLTRNVLLGTPCPLGNGNVVYQYGRLRIQVDVNNRIVSVENFHPTPLGFIDKPHLKHILNIRLGILN